MMKKIILSLVIILPFTFLFLKSSIPAHAATVFSDDFETGNFANWNEGIQDESLVEVTNQAAYLSNFGMHIQSSATGDDNRADEKITPVNQLYTRMAMKIVTDVADGDRFLELGGTEDGSDVGGLAFRTGTSGTNDRLNIKVGTTYIDTGYNMSIGVWHCVELQAVSDSSNGRVRAWVDGNLVADQRNVSTGITPISWIRLGSDGADATANYYFDNFQSDDSQQIGCAGFFPQTSPDIKPPIRYQGQPSSDINTTSTTLTLKTDEAATCKYDTNNVSYASMANTFATTGGTSHATPVTGLIRGNSYTYHVSCQDTSGNADTGDFTIAFNVENPQVQPGSLSLIPTYQSISVYSNFQADTNDNSTTILEWQKQGDTTWKKGMAMTVDRRLSVTGGNATYTNPYYSQYRASILGLQPNTTYNVRVTYADPDGVNGTSQAVATVTTWKDGPPAITGNTYYVATTGSDSNPGTLSLPFQTITKGINVMQPGDALYVRGGTYHEVAYFYQKTGTPDKYYTISNYNNEPVIIDADKTRANNMVIGESHYIYVHGFEMVNNNDDQTQSVEVGGTGALRILDSSDHIIIDAVNIHDFNDNAVRLDWDAAMITLENSTFYRDILANNVNDEGHLVSVWRSDRGNDVIRNNTFKDTTGELRQTDSYYDCLGGGSNFAINGFVKADSDIYGNSFYGCSDDQLEAEGGDVNVRAWNNIFTAGPNGFIGSASAPVIVGPYYYFRNVIWGTRHSAALKEGQASTGNKYYYNNTFFMTQDPTDVTTQNDVFEQTNAGLYNITSRNNVMHSNRYVIEYTTALSSPTMSFDYDLMYTSDPTRFVKWGDPCSCGSFAGFQAIGQEAHGLNFDDSNEYVDPANGDFHLKAGSQLIDKGQVILGFNDPDSAWPYVGAAPDIGAYEYGAVSPTPSITLGNGDANGDGTVNIADIKAILQNWLAFVTSSLDQYGDGRINSLDFVQVVNHL